MLQRRVQLHIRPCWLQRALTNPSVDGAYQHSPSPSKIRPSHAVIGPSLECTRIPTPPPARLNSMLSNTSPPQRHYHDAHRPAHAPSRTSPRSLPRSISRMQRRGYIIPIPILNLCRRIAAPEESPRPSHLFDMVRLVCTPRRLAGVVGLATLNTSTASCRLSTRRPTLPERPPVARTLV